MPRHALAELAKRAGDPHRLLDRRHMTALAALRVTKVAVEPLLIRHLFGELADLLAVGTEGGGDQGVARRTEFRLPHMLPLGRLISA